MLTELNFRNSNNILPLPTTDECCGTSDKCHPPQDQEKLMIMLKYIQNKEFEEDQLKAYRTKVQFQRIYYLLKKYVTYVVVISQNLDPFKPIQKL